MNDLLPSRQQLSKLGSIALTPLLILGAVLSALPAAAQFEAVGVGAVGDAVGAAVRPVPAMTIGAQGLSVLAAPSALTLGSAGALSAAPSLQAAAPLSAAAAASPAAAAMPVLAPAAAVPAAAAVAAASSEVPAAAPGIAVSAASGKNKSASEPASSQPSNDSARARLENIAKAAPDALAGKFDGNDGVAAPGDPALPPIIGKLGKQDPARDPRTLQFAKYIVRGALPATPAQVDFSKAVGPNWGMMLNDKIGDCAYAYCGHHIMAWTANAGEMDTPPDSAILKAYEATGYRPGQPSTDKGAQMLQVLKQFRKAGIDGHKIGAFASLDPTNFDNMRAAISIFGGVALGVAMPISAQKQTVWDVPAGGATGDGAPGSWGGHAVLIVGYGPQGVLVVTWGGLKWATWDFLKTYGDESYAIISKDFLKNGVTPNLGINVAALTADLKEVTGERPDVSSGKKPKPNPKPKPKKS